MAFQMPLINKRRPPIKRSAWKALENHYKKVRELHLRDLFARDPMRGERMAVEGVGIYLDYSKNRITDYTLKLLIQLAEESGLQARIDAMFRGEMVNTTENRPALHIALRAPRGASIFVQQQNVVPQVHAVLNRMSAFCNKVRSGEWKGYSGKPIRNIVNIGIGGSELGPMMAYEALKHYSDRRMTFRFVSNLDDGQFTEAVQDLDPAETLFIICSKTLTTPEIITNAQSARAWVFAASREYQGAVAKHFVAVCSTPADAARFGVEISNVFEFWDWVGGRYSMGSAVGLSTMLALGPENFRMLLNGFYQMDMHFLATPLDRNLPVLMGLLAIWNNNLFGAQTIAILPYDSYLRRFPAYLQQLAMGSNGKQVTLIGTKVTQHTSPIYWGETGTNGQHSFYQLIHQGTRLVPCDFIAFAQPLDDVGSHQDMLLANVFAQSEALAFGKTAEEVKDAGTAEWLVPHRVFEGNRPSNTILAEQLTPETLGKLVALYEHSVFTQAVIWNINPFDQWGIELGKELAQIIKPELESAEDPQLKHDSSTDNLIRRYRRLRRGAVDGLRPSC
jgi:glucose-6-phosphate isomerase